MKTTILMCSLILCIMLCSCNMDPSKPYTFYQEVEQVAKIEIIQQTSEHAAWEDRFIVRKELHKNDFSSIFAEIQGITGQPFINPPGSSFGAFLFKITYLDGMEEYIGCNNNGYLSLGKQLRYDTYYFSDREGFYNLISKYLEEDISADVSAWVNRPIDGD